MKINCQRWKQDHGLFLLAGLDSGSLMVGSDWRSTGVVQYCRRHAGINSKP